jgi:hypothetical protein
MDTLLDTYGIESICLPPMAAYPVFVLRVEVAQEHPVVVEAEHVWSPPGHELSVIEVPLVRQLPQPLTAYSCMQDTQLTYCNLWERLRDLRLRSRSSMQRGRLRWREEARKCFADRALFDAQEDLCASAKGGVDRVRLRSGTDDCSRSR